MASICPSTSAASSNSNDPLSRRGGLSHKSGSLLDRPLARGGALLVGLAAAALLIHIERDRFFAAEAPAESPSDVAFLVCFEKEEAVIRQMQEDGLVDEGRATLFISRAEARCRALVPSP